MRRILFTLFLLHVGVNSFSQCEYIEDSTVLRTIGNTSAPLCNSNFTFCSKNGYGLYPHTNYRVLNLMINIIYDVNPCLDPLYNNCNPPSAGAWNPGTPNSINTNPPNYLTAFMDQDFNTLPPQGIMTRKYYESSFGALHIVGDFVVIDLAHSFISGGSTFNSNSLIIKAVQFINSSGGLNTIFGYNSISDYDYCSTGFPGLPKNLAPNGKIDFVQILFRNSTLSYGGLKIGQGFTGLGLPTPISIGGNLYDGEIISAQAIGNGPLTNPNGIIIHEFSHNLFGSNNFHTSGGHHYGQQPITTFLGIQGGYGLMGSAGAGLTSVNAYERYRMGWYSPVYNPNQIEIQANGTASDVTQAMGTQTFILRDFVTTGDAIRIKLPYKDAGALDQYIWLENHKIGTNGKLDYLHYSDSHPQCRPQGTPGIYAYIEVGKNITESNTFQDVYPSGQADNLKTISAEGNFDHIRIPDEFINCVAWGNTQTYQQTAVNPLTGDCDQKYIFYDPSVSALYIPHGYAPFIQHRLNQNVDQNIPYLGDNKDAFTDGMTMEIGSNPPPVNQITHYYYNNGSVFSSLPTFNNKHTYLTGLKISFTQLTGGDYEVNIVWNDYDVKNDVRWCGDIILQEQVNLKQGKIMTLDQSRTANQVDRDPVSGEFTPVTTMTCQSGSYFHLESNSQLILENKSVLHLETGSQLTMESNSIVRVKKDCKLILDSKSSIINNGGRIIIEDGGTLEYQEADITLATSNSTLEIAGLLDLKSPVTGAYNIFTFGGLGYIIFNSPQLPTSSNVSCTPNDCIFQLNGQTGQLLLKVTQESLRFPVGLAYFIVEGGVCQFAAGQRAVRVMGSTTKTNLLSTVFTSTSGNYNTHWGLVLYGGTASVRYSTFLHGYQGIRNMGGDIVVENSTFQDCGFGIYSDGGTFNIMSTLFDQNRGFGISADNMTLPCYLTSSEIKNTTLTNGIGVFFDGSLTSSLKAVDNYIHNNKLGIQMKNTLLTGSCNMITDNQTNGIELKQGGYLDFSGNPGARSNVVKNNDVSLRLAVARDLFLAGGYNNLVPVQSGAQNAVRGSIKKPCPPVTIVADNNQWNASNTGISTSDYNLTTVAGSYQCNSAMPVTITDIAPASKQCSNMQLLVGSMNNPLYNCNNCETIYTSSFMGEKLNEAGLTALQQTTETGGLSDAQAVNLFNEMLMYNVPAPDDKEKYILNFSYAQMGTALGAAFRNKEVLVSDNFPALSNEVQKIIDVLNKQIAEAISNGDVLDRFYYSLDKVNVYRLAGRRDLAFSVLDDMYYLSVPSDELDYLNYKNCITHLEQDLIDGIITTDEYMDASLNCEQQSSGLRVYTPQNTNVNNEKLGDKISNGDMAKNITLSPNPATDKINIYNANDRILTLVLKDPVGSVVYHSELVTSLSLNCSEFARGFYTIQLFDKQSNMVYKEKVVLK